MPQPSFTSRTLIASACAFALLPGCMLEKQDDGAEFREAVPMREAVTVAGPQSDGDADTSAQSIAGVSRAQAERRLER